MPLYFFDIIDNGALSRDDHGIELASFEEARDQAQVLLPDIVRTELLGRDLHTFVCEVREEMRGMVYRGSLTCQGTLVAKRWYHPLTRELMIRAVSETKLV